MSVRVCTSLILHCGVLGTCLKSLVGSMWPWHGPCLSAYMLCTVCSCSHVLLHENYNVHVSTNSYDNNCHTQLRNAHDINCDIHYVMIINKKAYVYIAIHKLCTYSY